MAGSSASAIPELTPAGFDEYNAQLQAAALQATRHGVSLPTPSDLSFHRSLDRVFSKELDACSSRVLSLTNKLISLVSASSKSNGGNNKGKSRKLESEDDVVDHFHALVVDRMDELLEQADTCLDEMLGRSKPPAITITAPQQPLATKKQSRKPAAPQGRLDPALQHASHLAKPQLLFKRKPDNSSHTIWKSTLRHKYNAQVPLGYHLHDKTQEVESSSSTSHPYRYEITHLTYPPRLFHPSPPAAPRSFSNTPFTWVDTPTSLSTMLTKLRSATEIAVDLEYHSYRTFGGFVCLMQLSTREEDFVVDTLAVREEMEELNEVFTDPKIVKVLHGAESDIVWLQQDFNLYIVNLFDTYHASKVLEFPRHGLATLLEMYCDFTADKRYQLADWRIRPLPQEMLDYARSDTHFLLFIYDNLRNALLDRAQSSSARNSPTSTPPPSPPTSSAFHPSITITDTNPAHSLVHEVLARSAETSLRVYEKERYDEEGAGSGGWDTLARKWNKGSLTAEAERAGDVVGRVQRAVYRCVHAWRDRVAREEDESVRYVLPNHHLFQLADHPPADMATLLSLLHPVPPVVRRRGKELLDAIRDVMKEQLGGGGASASESNNSDFAAATMEVDAEIQSAGADATGSDVKQKPETADAGLVAESETSLTTTGKAVTKTALPVKSLWSIAAGTTTTSSSAAASSTLFGARFGNKDEGAAAGPKPSRTKLITRKSALFGATVDDIAERKTSEGKFQEVVSRINRTLIIVPTVEAVDAVKRDNKGDAEEGEGAPEEDNHGRMEEEEDVVHEEMAFVRAADRAAREDMKDDDDSIVVVGRKKKRKRAAEGGREDVAGFDYAGVSNILDEESGPAREQDVKKKTTKKKSNKTRDGAGREVKNRNMSRTFK